MLKTVKIENFRGFQSFELQQLGRVNLLVGKNNSGKTSILEAIQLLCSRNNLTLLTEVMINRGEYFFGNDDRVSRQLDIRHLFYGHQIQVGSTFSIGGMNDNINEHVVASIAMRDSRRQKFDDHPDLGEDFNEIRKLGLIVKWTHGHETENLSLSITPDGGVSTDFLRPTYHKNKDTSLAKTQFVTSSSLTTEKMIELFNQVVLTPEENLVQEALQTIEPKIERIASISPQRRSTFDSRGGFVIRLCDRDQRVPIGSMGDGIWRILGLALSTVCAKNGYLFVDEIDTGLHFTAMSDMWKLVWKTATRLNVQVFATTHSNDCWTSLADIASQEKATEDGITIQRIEREKQTGIAFTEREIVIAAQRGIEVR
ncbi:chromosome segregation protein SMC [Scytonema hofmannii PCC 7110]|uniref:Chromosome segregation protein SMC n=1 Tax=Scytonema hofmannii PCC 7110 TaxID=128403 RepID=A0A139X522_9CYAN|nr:ATP-binding protein [Scytonema hofmannii]KYC39811.1 chromosome segregation protein SMC [Scytonema hofmannii PCC 7110]